MLLTGFGMADITPPLGVELAGYGYYLARRARSIHDSLFARALAIEDGGERFALISCDVLGLTREIACAVRDTLTLEHGVPREHVVLVSVHTHTGAPTIYHEGCGEVCPQYVATVAPAIARACALAFADLAPVSALDFSMARVDGQFAYNRASTDGQTDDYARAFHIRRENAAPIALYSYACHAVCRGRSDAISADYPGAVCNLAEDAGARGMFLNGLCGDIDPVSCENNERDARLLVFARAIVRAGTGEKAPLPLTVSGGRLDCTLRLLMPESPRALNAAADAAATREGMIPGADRVARVWEREMLAKWPSLRDTEDVSVPYLFLGGVPIVALPFEGFTCVGALLRKTLGDPRALVLGCAEEILGYLPSREDIARKAYAAYESTFLYKRLPVLPGEGERIGELLGTLLSRREN